MAGPTGLAIERHRKQGDVTGGVTKGPYTHVTYILLYRVHRISRRYPHFNKLHTTHNPFSLYNTYTFYIYVYLPQGPGRLPPLHIIYIYTFSFV